MIAAPDHLARRGMNPLVRPRERHADAKTKAGPDTAFPKLPGSAAMGQRHGSRYFTAHNLVWYDCGRSHVRAALRWDVS